MVLGGTMIGHRMNVPAILFSLAVLFAGSARAAVTEDNFQLRTAGDLVTLCSADPSDRYMTAAANFCQGFTVGVFRTLQDEQAALRAKLFCPTEPLPTRSEAIARFIAWANSRPDVLRQKPEDAILAYLQERFPCASRR